jgi:hypothetical protein
MSSGLSTPVGERADGLIDESETLDFSTKFTNHAPFSKLYDVSCPTPWSVAKRIASELALYIRYGFKLLGFLGLGEAFDFLVPSPAKLG